MLCIHMSMHIYISYTVPESLTAVQVKPAPDVPIPVVRTLRVEALAANRRS